MNNQLSDTLLISLREYLLSNMGLNFTEKHDKELIRKIGYAASAFEFTNTIKFIDWLLRSALNDQQMGTLASHITIGETYFFREKKSFDFIEQIYLPGLIIKRYGAERRLRVWCAGCATGEEAYSLAIILTQTIPDIKNWNISILATDINPLFLDQAQNGIYKKWSFRNNTEEFISKYFEKKGENEFHILPEIKKMVQFSYQNLADESYPDIHANLPSVDILFCRNVLIYFSPEGGRQVSERFYDSLADGGILVVSPVEMSSLISPKFNTIHYSGFTIYHKGKLSASKKVNATNEISDVKPVPSAVVPHQNKVQTFRQEEKPEQIQKKEPLQEKKILPEAPAEKGISENEFVRAQSLFETGSFDDAEILLDGPLKQSNPNGKTLLLLAKTKANLGKLKEAEELCEKGLGIDKLNTGFHYLYATVMQEKGNDEKAIASLKISVYLEPDFVLAHFLLGTLSLKAGNQAAGTKSFKNALASLSKLSPRDVIPEADGLTAERFIDIIYAIQK
jgi:chemotaxis protein methyltransferase CheR